jgi:hypothetical protein
MNRWLAYALGPEALWILLYLVSSAVAARNVPPTPAGTAFLERATILLPATGVPLTFLAYAVPGTNRWVLLARIALAIFVGLNASLFAIVGRIDYGDSRNSGTLGFWVYGILVGIVAFVASGIVTFFLLRTAGARGGPA